MGAALLTAQPADAGSAALRVEPVSDAARVPSLRGSWDLLVSRYPQARVYLTHHYASAWLRAFGDGVALRLFVVRRGKETVALFPMMLATCHAYGVPLRQLSFLRNHHVLRADALAPEAPLEATRAVLAHLAERAAEWDVAYLHDVPETSPLLAAVPEAAAAAGLRCDPWSAGRRHRFLPIQGTWDDYLASRSANFRWQAKKFRKRLRALGELDIRCIADRDGLKAALPELFVLERSSWQGRSRASAMDEADRLFCRALIEEAPDGQLGEMWQLRVGGKLVSSLQLLNDGRRLYSFTSYYDEAFAAAGPGFFLKHEMLREVWQRKLDAFDFNGESLAFSRFTPLAQAHYCTRLYAPGVKGRLAHASHGLISRLRSAAGAPR